MTENDEGNMSFNPIAPVKDYTSMLNRIFVLTLVSASIAVWFLRMNWPWLQGILSKLDINVEIGPVKEIKLLGYILPGACLAFAARTIRLHDRISDICGIRRRFDVDCILLPLAKGSGANVGALSMMKLRRDRGRLMAKTFYKYTSSTGPVVDRHLINQALDWWSWYWVLVEAVAVFIPTGIALLFFGNQPLGWSTLGASVVAMLATQFFRSHCAGYAQNEVDEILDDPTRKAAVQQVFNAL